MKIATIGQESIDRTALKINAIASSSMLAMALIIGQTIIDELYSGDINKWRDRGPKEHSLRQLATSPLLQVSASVIYRSLGIYELRVRLGGGPAWERLTLSHFRAVLGLPEVEQRRLLACATEQDWSSTRLETVASESRSRYKHSKGGRPRKPRFLRSIDVASRALADEDDVFADLDSLEEMDAEQRELLVGKLELIRQRCNELAAFVDATV